MFDHHHATPGHSRFCDVFIVSGDYRPAGVRKRRLLHGFTNAQMYAVDMELSGWTAVHIVDRSGDQIGREIVSETTEYLSAERLDAVA